MYKCQLQLFLGNYSGQYLARPDQEVDGQCHYDGNWDGNTPLRKVFMDVRNYVNIVRYLVSEPGCSLVKGGRKKGRERISLMDTH